MQGTAQTLLQGFGLPGIEAAFDAICQVHCKSLSLCLAQ
jgi:hypothetical protein